MKNAELYKGFSEKQAEHEGWLVERYGGPMRKAVSHAPKLSYEQSNAMSELRDIEQSLASAMEKGIEPEARELDMLVERHHRWVSRMWPQPCTMDAYAGLADTYDHPDFARRYETLAPGLASWLPTAMKAWARPRPPEVVEHAPVGTCANDGDGRFEESDAPEKEKGRGLAASPLRLGMAPELRTVLRSGPVR